MLSLLSTESVRRPRRCSICRDTHHDRRFHSVNERIQQTNRINANRENRLLQQRLGETSSGLPQPHNQSIQDNRDIDIVPTTIPPQLTSENIPSNRDAITTPINNEQLNRRMKNFKLVLERIARRESRMVDLIRNVRIFGAVDLIVQYAIELGAPTNRTFNAYFYRVISLLYVMFNDLHVYYLNEIIIGDYYMRQPDSWFFNYCMSVATNQREQTDYNISDLRQKRLDKLLQTKRANISNSSAFECPICYENIPKLNSIQTPCNHHFCRDCFSQFALSIDADHSLHCPLCRFALFHSFIII